MGLLTFLPILVNLFLNVLEPDEYQVIIKQQQIFAVYENILASIVQVSPSCLDRPTALCYAQALYKGANVYRRIATEKSLRQALLYHRKALALRKRYLPSHDLAVAQSYVALGATFNELHGDEYNTRAIVCYKKALRMYRDAHNNALEASTLNNLANAYRDLNDVHVPLAISYQDQALSLLEALPDTIDNQREKGKSLHNQGKNYHRLGGTENSNRAIDFLRKALSIFEWHNDTVRIALTLSYLGHVYTGLGYVYETQALEALHESLRLFRMVYDDGNPQIIEALERIEMAKHQLRITPLTRDTIPGVKRVIAEAWNDVMGLNHTVEDWQSDGYFDPIDNFETEFLLFLTLLDGDRVVGCAAVRHLDGDICELKRMWLLRPYRRHGWGSQMLSQLLEVAKDRGFRYVRLEVYRPSKQAPAIAFYRKFGFYEIPPYCESLPEALFMEKELA